MTDQSILALKKKLDALSSGKPQEKQEPVKEVKLNPVSPLPQFQEKKNVLDELTPEQIKELKEKLFPQENQEEVQEEVNENDIDDEISDEDLEQFRKIQAEIERLQNTGAYRVEVLYQLLGINVTLNKISIALEKLANGKR